MTLSHAFTVYTLLHKPVNNLAVSLRKHLELHSLDTIVGIMEQSVASISTVTACPEHPNEGVEVCCETCEKLVCLKCVLKCGKHYDHNCEPLKDALEKYKKAVKLSLMPLEGHMVSIDKALEQLHTSCEDISRKQEEIKDSIKNTIEQLQRTLDTRKTLLFDQLDQITEGKLKSLRDQRGKLLAHRASCVDIMKKHEIVSPDDVLKMKTGTIKEVQVPVQPEGFFKPSTKADMEFSKSENVLADCQNYGWISVPIFPDPSKCHATGLETANVDEMSTVALHAIDYQGESCVYPISSIECELISEITGTRVLGKVEIIEQSKYKISYQPSIKGRHHLHIKVEGQHIRGSPFSVAVKSSIQKLGTPFHSIKGVKGPCGVALNHKQELVVTGYRDNRVHLFSPDTRFIRFFETWGPGQLSYPGYVAVDDNGNILVADGDNHRIQIFTAEGQFIKSVGSDNLIFLMASHSTLSATGYMLQIPIITAFKF